MRRHIFIPDTQIKPGVPTDHIDWVAQAIVDYEPDVVIVGGDWWDMHSLNSYETPGSIPLEGARYKDDIDIGNEAFERLCRPMEAEISRKKSNKKKAWSPRKIFLTGNHEDRADRAALHDAKWAGHVGSENCNIRDFERHRFLEIVEVDDILYSHFFKMQNSNNPIGGSTDNRLNKIGRSHTQGHQVGFLYGNRVYPDGKTRHSLTAGSCYLHQEEYRGPQCNKHFRGIIVKNEVCDGNYDIMPVSLNYLCRKFCGTDLVTYMRKKYSFQDWDHLAS